MFLGPTKEFGVIFANKMVNVNCRTSLLASPGLFFSFWAVEELEESQKDTDFEFNRYIRSENNSELTILWYKSLDCMTGNFSSGTIFKLCGLCKFTRKLTDVKYELIVYARFTRMFPERFEDLLTLVLVTESIS